MNIDNLTPEQKRVKIAEVCGWIEIGVNTMLGRKESGVEAIPDYLSDLNAMHEAEKVLNRAQRIPYLTALERRTSIQNSSVTIDSEFAMTCATAAQRADAFLLSMP